MARKNKSFVIAKNYETSRYENRDYYPNDRLIKKTNQ